MLETLLLAVADFKTIDKNQILAWIETKKFRSEDFVFLNILQTESEKQTVSAAFLKCSQLNASFSETLQILELVTELTMINSQYHVLRKSDNIDTWKHELKTLRYPQTTLSDQDLKTKLESLPWPNGAKIKFERRGDRAGVELKLFITSSADLLKSISALERVKDQL